MERFACGKLVIEKTDVKASVLYVLIRTPVEYSTSQILVDNAHIIRQVRPVIYHNATIRYLSKTITYLSIYLFSMLLVLVNHFRTERIW